MITTAIKKKQCRLRWCVPLPAPHNFTPTVLRVEARSSILRPSGRQDVRAISSVAQKCEPSCETNCALCCSFRYAAPRGEGDERDAAKEAAIADARLGRPANLVIDRRQSTSIGLRGLWA